MFFKDRINSLQPSDSCLDIGPGAFPFSKATHYLEVSYSTPEEARKYRSGFELPLGSDKWTFYDGKRMPFQDHEFNYSICSHVLQMAGDPDALVKEIVRVSRSGYVEFPHPLYDYLFNYSAHKYFVNWNGSEILWLDKSYIQFDQFQSMNQMMFSFFEKGYCDFVEQLKNQMFVGFEWKKSLHSRKVKSFQELFTATVQAEIPRQSARQQVMRIARTELRTILRRVGI